MTSASAFDVVADLGNDAPCRRHVGREQRGEAGVAPEDPEDADPLVAAERRPLAIDEFLRPGDGRREPDAVLGPGRVVVHRLGDRDQREPLRREDPRERQRVVAADGDEGVDAQLLEVLEDDGREVEAILADLHGVHARRFEPRRERPPGHLRGVRPGRVEDRPARPVDRPRVRPIEVAEVFRIERRAGHDVGQALPAATDADDLGPELRGPVGGALDDRIEAGDVAAAGEDADTSWSLHRADRSPADRNATVAGGLRRPPRRSTAAPGGATGAPGMIEP